MADKLLGSFVWCELMTTDAAAAESFYTKVVGWGTEPFGPDGSYTVLSNSLGTGVGGIMAIPADATGMPPNWMMYIGAPDVDATAMRVAQLGGRVHKQPTDIPNVGRFAVVSDPYGAMFNIFKPQGPDMDRSKGTGRFSWFELYTPNPEGAWKFYESLFGWEKTSAMDMGREMGVYQMFGRGGGIPNGGIMKPPPGAPAAWMPYALVADAKAAAAAATANGGKIINGPMEVPGGDWIAVGIDPQGATFAVHSLNPGGVEASGDDKKSGARTRTSGARARKSGGGTKTSGARTRTSGARARKSGTRTRKSGGGTKTSGARTKKSGGGTRKSGAGTKKSGAGTRKSGAVRRSGAGKVTKAKSVKRSAKPAKKKAAKKAAKRKK